MHDNHKHAFRAATEKQTRAVQRANDFGRHSARHNTASRFCDSNATIHATGWSASTKELSSAMSLEVERMVIFHKALAQMHRIAIKDRYKMWSCKIVA